VNTRRVVIKADEKYPAFYLDPVNERTNAAEIARSVVLTDAERRIIRAYQRAEARYDALCESLEMGREP
jgi:hypothetical protein